jgi:hypothetical protein
MVGCIVISLQAGLDEFPLRLGEKLGGFGIVMDEPISGKGNDNS